MATWDAAAAETDAALLRLQKEKGAEDDQLATISPITAPTQATKESGSRTRALAATVILGLGFTLALAYGAESSSQYRRARRRARDDRGGGRDGSSHAPADAATRLERAMEVDAPPSVPLPRPTPNGGPDGIISEVRSTRADV